MLVYKNDYVTIDAERADIYKQPFTETDEIEQEKYRNEGLIFHFTVQCNGKMKRSSIKVDVKKQSENCVEVGDVNGYNLKQYDQLYLPLQLLFDLGYDVPIEIKANSIAHKALELFN